MSVLDLQQAKFIKVSAAIRYWEDATLNGEPDEDGCIPCRNGDVWEPVIDLDTGKIINWKQGSTASIHYKVCDEGEYYLLDTGMNPIFKWGGYYVPDSILCMDDDGFSDYIVFRVNEDGSIPDWKKPNLKVKEWDIL